MEVIGRRIPRLDAKVKVTGEATYTGDITLPRMLIGKILMSPLPHAKILHIDASKALKKPEVKAIITGKDTLGIKTGLLTNNPKNQDYCCLASDKVRFMGEATAAVAAMDEETAQEALELIYVDYEELPYVFDPYEAMKPKAPRIHEEAEDNISNRFSFHYGEVEKAFSESDYVRDDTFQLEPLIHGFMEKRIAMANFGSDGKLTLWTPIQNPHFLRIDLARSLGLGEGKVRIIKPHMGGGHCGKLEMLPHHFCSALLSKKTGRPVKIECSIDETFAFNRGAHNIQIHIKTGVKRDGRLIFIDCRLIADAGAYTCGGPLFNFLSGSSLTLPYRLPNLRYEGFTVFTNNPPNSTQRALGWVSMRFAAESQMDIIAEEIGVDPLEMRMINALKPGETTINGFKITSCGFTETLEGSSKEMNWKERKVSGYPSKRGMGLSCGGFTSGSSKTYLGHNSSAAFINTHPDGTVTLLTGAPELGQGSDTLLAQIVAEVLGIPPEKILITSADTEITPMDLGAYGSRVTMTAGMAVLMAASDAKEQLLQMAAEKLEANPQDLAIMHERIYLKGSPHIFIPMTEVIKASEALKGKPIMGKGYYNPDTEIPDPITGMGNRSPAYNFGTEIAEVVVDSETGIVKVEKMAVGWDCGVAINPSSVEGQIEGQVAFGIGQALLEERILEKGQALNPSYLDYKMPTAMEMPSVKSILADTFEPNGPFGAKECGEGPQVPVTSAIVNAIYRATGIRIKNLPINPEMLTNLGTPY